MRCHGLSGRTPASGLMFKTCNVNKHLPFCKITNTLWLDPHNWTVLWYVGRGFITYGYLPKWVFRLSYITSWKQHTSPMIHFLLEIRWRYCIGDLGKSSSFLHKVYWRLISMSFSCKLFLGSLSSVAMHPTVCMKRSFRWLSARKT